MKDDAAGFTGSIPEHYDQGLGPVIFVDYAADMAHRVAACAPTRILETAAGSGIVTRQLRDVLPIGVQLTATDLNAPMLDVARTKFQPGEQVEFKPADAMALPFEDGSFDAVVCQFGVMFFPDRQSRTVRSTACSLPVVITCSVSGTPIATTHGPVSHTKSPDGFSLPIRLSSITCHSPIIRPTR